MIKDYLLKLKDQIFNKKELEYLDYINKRDLVIYDLTRDWSDEEIDQYFTPPDYKMLKDLEKANDKIISEITGAAP